MKTLFLLFAIAVSCTASASCRFSIVVREHWSATPDDCGETFCPNVIVCDGELPKLVICKSKAGTCDGFDANECAAQSKTLVTDGEQLTK